MDKKYIDSLVICILKSDASDYNMMNCKIYCDINIKSNKKDLLDKWKIQN